MTLLEKGFMIQLYSLYLKRVQHPFSLLFAPQSLVQFTFPNLFMQPNIYPALPECWALG